MHTVFLFVSTLLSMAINMSYLSLLREAPSIMRRGLHPVDCAACISIQHAVDRLMRRGLHPVDCAAGISIQHAVDRLMRRGLHDPFSL
jgi:fructose-1,6-bisphosphatase/inositol monophosphatase family enzyme